MRDLNDRAGGWLKHLAAGADPPPAGAACVCSKQSARLMPGQTGFQRGTQQRANAKDGVGCAGRGYRCLPAGLDPQDGLQLDLRQLRCVLRWEKKKMQPAPQS